VASLDQQSALMNQDCLLSYRSQTQIQNEHDDASF